MTQSLSLAGPEDGPAVVALLATSGLPELGILDHLDTTFVARTGAALVGCAALEVYADGALLRSVAVEPGARGSGLGRRLVDAALEHARRLGAPAVFLLTTTASAYFRRFGFVDVSRAEVPPGVLRSEQFRGATCASAVVMRRI